MGSTEIRTNIAEILVTLKCRKMITFYEILKQRRNLKLWYEDLANYNQGLC